MWEQMEVDLVISVLVAVWRNSRISPGVLGIRVEERWVGPGKKTLSFPSSTDPFPIFSLLSFRIVLSVLCILTAFACCTMYLAVKCLPLPLDHALLVGTKDAFFTTVHLEQHCVGCAP